MGAGLNLNGTSCASMERMCPAQALAPMLAIEGAQVFVAGGKQVLASLLLNKVGLATRCGEGAQPWRAMPPVCSGTGRFFRSDQKANLVSVAVCAPWASCPD